MSSMSVSNTIPPPLRIGIIGTSGRDEYSHRLSKTLWKRMIDITNTIITCITSTTTPIVLVSGGAAWTDHIAVTIWNQQHQKTQIDEKQTKNVISGLELHLPSRFSLTKACAIETEGSSHQRNTAHTLNTLHHTFSNIIGSNTLNDIVIASKNGARIYDYHSGFLARNTYVAKCDLLIALTWYDDNIPPPRGGTRDTWNKCMGAGIHIPLALLEKNDTSIHNIIKQLIIHPPTQTSKHHKIPKTITFASQSTAAASTSTSTSTKSTTSNTSQTTSSNSSSSSSSLNEPEPTKSSSTSQPSSTQRRGWNNLTTTAQQSTHVKK